MSRVLITGANGFIGSHLVEKFASQGHEVFGLVRSTSDLSLIKDMPLTLRYGDVTDADQVMESLRDIDILIHNAGLASDWGPLELFRKINVDGTRNLAKAAREHCIQRFVQMSSTAIHGFSDQNQAVCEDDPKNPVFNYCVSKLEAENSVLAFGRENDIEVTAVRPGNVFGPRDHTFIEKYIDAIRSGNIAYVNGGRNLTCPTFVGNLVHGVYLATFAKQAAGEAFLITDGLHINWRHFTEKIADQMAIRRPKMSIPFWLGMAVASLTERLYLMMGAKHAPLITKYRICNGGTDYHFSIDKARRLLGYEPVYDLENAINQTVVWYKTKYGLE